MSIPILTLKKSAHRGADVIQLHFSRSHSLQDLLRPAVEVRWSKTMNCWYTPYKQGLTKEIITRLNGKANVEFGKTEEKPRVIETVKEVKDVSVHKTVLTDLNEEGKLKAEEFRDWLSSKRYSANTINTYIEAIKIFLRFYAFKPVAEICNNDVIVFNNQYILANKLSSSFQNQLVNAIKLFFSSVQDTKLAPELVHRPKRAKVLPNVLSKEEVKAVLTSLTNIKHKTMLSLIYSCGLRSGELLTLKFEHVDTKRGLLIIKQAKGRKDRVVPLSHKTIIMLEEYLAQYKPKKFLFEGQEVGGPYDARSLQNVLKQSVHRAGIKKPVTLHWLRHSYATHLLENGTDLRYIQEILGHSSSRTTEIYTHVSTHSIQRITSPFDYL
jgi:integrase/recombinase XerD